jgi:hypothetical protein
VDDERIKELTAEVMKQLSHSSAAADLEDRVAALEKAVHGRLQSPMAIAVASVPIHPSHSLLGPEAPPGGRCVMEPDKPCVQSGMCRTLGH